MSSPAEIRCFCSSKPLLAKTGRDSRGRTFLHVKVFKQRRLYTEIMALSGVVRICCRECFRWHEVVIRDPLERREVPQPQELEHSQA
jgi:hypothetical protein